MRKFELVALWMEGDDAAVAQKIGASRQAVRYWRQRPDVKSKWDAKIWQAAKELGITERGVEWRLVPVKMAAAQMV